LPLGEDWRIDIKKGEKTGTNYILNYDLQSYVPVPTAGEAPVKEFTAMRDLDVYVVWKDEEGNSPDVFALDTVYKADITLTAKNGYIFNPGVAFRYPAGTVAVQPQANTDAGVRVLSTVTYLPAAPAVLITGEDLARYIPAPVTGGTAVVSFSGSGYTGTVEWEEEGTGGILSGLFLANTAYRAEVTLRAAAGRTFTGIPGTPAEGAFSHSRSATVSHTEGGGSSLALIITFGKTDAGGGGVPLSFSGKLEKEGDSAIDAIRAAKKAGWADVFIMWNRVSEKVSLGADTDLGTTGLVLSTVNYKIHSKLGYIAQGHVRWDDNDPSTAYNSVGVAGAEFSANSPAEVFIDGLWPGREVALAGLPGAPLITVGDGVTLVLRNITLKGMDNNTRPLVLVKEKGVLIMETGALITGNTNLGDDSWGSNQYNSGGGVMVSGGTFKMTGGTISGNKSKQENDYDKNLGGGGVGVVNGGTFTMTGGSITNNVAEATGDWGSSGDLGGGGGVLVYSGMFTMDGGSITSNEAKGKNPIVFGLMGFGGGVLVNWKMGGRFDKKAGDIANTIADYGRQVFVLIGGIGMSTYTYRVRDSALGDQNALSVLDGFGVSPPGLPLWEGGNPWL
jgi:hypothetical protein